MAGSKRPRHPCGQKKPALTHFLCLPLVNDKSRAQLERSMNQFEKSVVVYSSRDATSAGTVADTRPTGSESVELSIHPKAIRPVGTLHCTLGVMSLFGNKLSQAVETLRAIDVSGLLRASRGEPLPSRGDTLAPEVFTSGSRPMSLDRPITPPSIDRQTQPLIGLISMHDPHKTSVLYAAPTDVSERLYPFCSAVQKTFADAGFLVPDDRPLKLHATIVNTIYARGRRNQRDKRANPPSAVAVDDELSTHAASAGPSTGELESAAGRSEPGADERSQDHGPDANAPLKIDTTALLARFNDFSWAENVVLDRIAICEMGAKKILDAQGRVAREEYTEVASVALPAATL
ncbi:hypothetical protein LTR53_007977 [Teratosphaeriaceae sp. CCFEE 6253]|nr:hypothetical protein LTR53_007977 [Teratosphaeriaceae sp. CCFEE 6253]